MMNPLNVAMIYGSVRPGRLCETVASWAAGQIAARANLQLDLIDPAADWPHLRDEHIREQIGRADAFVIVTPEHNHSYPGPLKVLIDVANAEWHAKPVGFVSYGGVSGGLRAVEHLRNVFVELHAVPIRDSVAFPNAWEAFADGKPIDELRSSRSMQVMMSRLEWWAQTLKAARERHAYGEAA
jgi:NAD(P)H-dependent FMN reductase